MVVLNNVEAVGRPSRPSIHGVAPSSPPSQVNESCACMPVHGRTCVRARRRQPAQQPKQVHGVVGGEARRSRAGRGISLGLFSIDRGALPETLPVRGHGGAEYRLETQLHSQLLLSFDWCLSGGWARSKVHHVASQS